MQDRPGTPLFARSCEQGGGQISCDPAPPRCGDDAHSVNRGDPGGRGERQIGLADRLSVEKGEVAMRWGPAGSPVALHLGNEFLLCWLIDLPVGERQATV